MKSAVQGNIKIEIDRDLCIGAASCSILAPKTFVLDDQGKVDLLEGEWDELTSIEAAADSCPVRAIIVTKLDDLADGHDQLNQSAPVDSTQTLDIDVIMAELKTVLDPELGINVVDLGLVYGVYQNDSTLNVDMTLTTPGCPLINEFIQSVHQALIKLDGVDDVIVNLTFDPPWTPDKMSPEAAEELGFLL